MPHRGYVLIFVSWALLAIIGPTLVLWSSSEQRDLLLKDQESGGIGARKMMASTDRRQRQNTTEGEPLGAPAPTPRPLWGNETVSRLRDSFCSSPLDCHFGNRTIETRIISPSLSRKSFLSSFCNLLNISWVHFY
ncbi:hypothetical protein HPP92_008156 [Vanilla planifolia]|uniref:Uncharacterized protein n=1 Tax=Vanilla planifolia TaxID=51239 RepID=A0A835R299_VANPL|nr:hypothetical protein HPP92_008315 [Vanilla planifolia]KAG0486061.1 hypothetical protein HPP92_008156 [Vanilla planifolia]